MSSVQNYIENCGTTKTLKLGCAQCIVHLPTFCSLSTDLFTILPTYSPNSTADPGKKQYMVNKALLIHFLRDQDMDVVRADSLFNDTPEISDLPVLKVFQNQAQNFIAQDVEIKLKLHKAVQAMKNDSAAIHSIADAYIAEPSLLASNWTDSWTNWLTVAFVFVSILQTIQLARLSLKVKSLALTLALVQQPLVQRTQAQIVNRTIDGKFVLSFTTKPIFNSTLNVLKPWHKQVVDTIVNNWSVITTCVLGFLLLILLIVVIKVCYMRCKAGFD